MTKLINIYGAPGSGKTTFAAAVYSWMKRRHYHVEPVWEYAKELVYQDTLAIYPQGLIWREMMRRHQIYYNKVDYVITDAPMMMNSVYAAERTDYAEAREYAWMSSNFYKSYGGVLNFMLPKPVAEHYNPEGRMHDVEQAQWLHHQIEDLANNYGQKLIHVSGHDHPETWELLEEFLHESSV